MSQEFHQAYTSAQRSEETVRETEAHALLNCASRLELARREGASREEFGEAVRHNQQLWTVFQTCLCEADNPLPRELKTILLNLSLFVDKVSFRACAESNPRLLDSLININRVIAAGLAKKPEKEAASTTYPAPSAETTPPSVMTSA